MTILVNGELRQVSLVATRPGDTEPGRYDLEGCDYVRRQGTQWTLYRPGERRAPCTVAEAPSAPSAVSWFTGLPGEV
jgi:hypothetical protein